MNLENKYKKYKTVANNLKHEVSDINKRNSLSSPFNHTPSSSNNSSAVDIHIPIVKPQRLHDTVEAVKEMLADKKGLPKLTMIKRASTLDDNYAEFKEALDKLKEEKADKATVEQEGKYILGQIESLKSWLGKMDDMTSMKLQIQSMNQRIEEKIKDK